MTSSTANSTDDPDLAVVRAGLLVIGDEILSGRTVDKNIHTLAERCTACGLQLSEVRVVGDQRAMIIAALQAMMSCYDYVFTTGGIGPTHDDITAESVAEAFSVPLLEDAEALEILRDHYGDEGLSDARRLMARVPEGGRLIRNSISAAPGFMIKNVIVMAGVPKIVEVMLDDVLSQLRVGRKVLSVSVQVHQPESRVADLLRDLDERSADISIGSYPFFRDGVVGATIVVRGFERAVLDDVVGKLTGRFKAADFSFQIVEG